MAAKDIEVKVKYIPDTSALKSAMSGMSSIDFKTGNSNVKKELVAPVQAAMKEVNKALASGADSSTLLQLFQKVGKEADAAKTKASAMLSELNTVFKSSGNQKLLNDLEEYRKKISQTEKQIENWDKKFGNAIMKQMKTDLYGTGKGGVAEARKEIASMEEQLKIGKQLTQQDEERLALLKKYVSTWNERQAATPKNELESQLSEYRAKESDILSQVQTPTQNVEETKRLTAIITQMGSAYGLSTQEINKLTTALKIQDDVVKQNKKELTKFGDIVTGTFLGTSIGNLFQTGIQRGIQFFKEYDETLTRTMMVTGMTREEVNGLTSSYNKLANQLSSTTKDVAAAQLVFYQQGLGTKEALDMTEASIAISKTGGIDAAEAANRLTAAVRGYQLAANDAMDIADKMSALDAAAASSVDELTVAMQKSASQAKMAGLDLDYYMAYLSTMQEVTREAPENIGTAMKSITSRMQEIRDIGKIEEDGTTFSNVAKALNSIGIAAVDTTGQLRPLQEIMNELGPMWATLDRNHQAYIATVLAGNRQQSRFIALMDNYDRALELVDVSQNASGESAKQLRAYNQGLEASFTALSNAWQQFATKLADSEVIKGVVDLLTDIIELFNKLPKGITSTLIPMAALVKTFATISKAGDLFKGFKDWFGEKTGIDTFIKQTDNLNKTLDKTPKFLKEFYGAFKEGKGIVSENADAIEDSSSTIESNSTVVGTNIAARETLNAEVLKESTTLSSNDAIKADETVENAAIMTSQTRLGEAVENVNDELREQNALFGINDNSKKQKIATDLDETTNQLSMLRNRRETAIGKQDALKGEMHERLSKARSDYEARADVFVRQFRAAEKLGIKNYHPVLAGNKDDLLATLKAQAFTSKGNPKRTADGKNAAKMLEQLKKDYHEIGVEYNQLQKSIKSEYFNVDDKSDRYSGLLGVGNKEIDDIDKQIKKLQNKKKKIQKELSKPVEIPEPQPGKGLLADLKSIGSDQNLTGIQKLGKGFGTLSKSVGGFSGILSNVAIGAMVSMGAETIGLDEDLSSALGTFTGVGKTLAGFGPGGWVAAAGIAGLQLAFDKAWPSVERTQEKLAELQQEMDDVAQKKTDIETSLKTYEDLSGKLNKTEEETQQLKDSTEQLVKLVPGAVVGYNQYGEAVLNVAAAYEELDKKQREMSAIADKQLVVFDNLQKGAQKTEKTWFSIVGVLGAVATAAAFAVNPLLGAGVAAATTAGMLTWDDKIDQEQLEENRKVWDENYSEILKSYQIKRDEFLIDVADANKDTASKILDGFIDSIMEEGRNGRISDASAAIEELLGNIEGVNWTQINKAIEHLDIKEQFSKINFKEARETLEQELKESLKAAGLDDVQINTMITAVLNIAWEGASDVEALKKAIDTEIENLQNGGGDQTRITYLKEFKKGLDELNQEELKMLKNADMLDIAFTDVFAKNGGVKNFINTFKNSNGEINKSRAIIDTVNELLGEQEVKQQKITEYEEKNKKEKENYLATLKEIAKAEANGFNFRNDEEKQDWINRRYERLKGIDWNDEDDGITFESEVTSGQQNKIKDAWAQYTNATSENNKVIKEAKGDINDYEDAITDLMSKIETYAVPTFDELTSKIEEMKESWDAFLGLAEHLDDTNGILDVDGIIQMFDLLGSFEGVAFETQEQFDAWMHAIDAVNNGLYEENGQLMMTADAMTGINDLISYSTRLKANDMLMSIERGKAELLNQREVLVMQKQAIDSQIANIKAMDDTTYKSLVEEGKLQETFKDEYIKLLDTANMYEVEGEENKLKALTQMQNNYFKQIAAMRTAYAKGEDIGDVKWMDIKGEYSKVYNKFVNDTADAFTGLITTNKADTLAALEAQSAELNTQIGNLDKRINSEVKLKETIAEYLNNPNTNLGQAFGDNSQEQVKDYNEKLERTLTLLEKIAGLQHTIDENETFKSIYEGYDGEAYGRLLMTNLNLAQEQYEVYKDLFDMQQEMTDQAAGDLLDSPYGSMFKISENGDLGWASDEMYEKYKGLPEDMQEDIDNLVDAYQEQRDELRDTEKELSGYAQAVKEAREELVQMEIEIENELVDALKNREKILHDARVKALDDEISMIEEAVEARKKAREEDESEKELYAAQEALRRATLDSSGKNNAQLLQLQQDLEDKQLEISEKRFEDDMEDRKNWLQDTKDAETETYEYRLETMTWYWENVQVIQEAGQEAMMQTLIHWNEQYRTTSELQQREMEREWQFTMDAMKTAADMGAELGQLTIDIAEVTSEVESMNISIDKLPGTWQRATDAANAYSAAARQASSYKPTSYGPTGNGDTGDTGDGDNPPVEEKYEGNMKKGDEIEFKPAGGNGTTIATYDENGISNGSIKDPTGYDRNYKAGNIKKINGFWMVDIGGGQYVPVHHFQKPGGWGWGKDDTRYYASGGMVDYTGPAWVDGTKTKPEAFLNPYQTQQIGALAEALDSKSINSANMNSNVTFGSINFNVASMSSAADGKKALEMFVQGANELMAKKGIGTKLNMNVK